MLVWCTILVTVLHFQSETAAQGKVISESPTQYLVDFSEYAKKHEYEGDYSRRLIDKDVCIKDEVK